MGFVVLFHAVPGGSRGSERKGKVREYSVELSDEKTRKTFCTKKNICLHCAHHCRRGCQKPLRKQKNPKTMCTAEPTPIPVPHLAQGLGGLFCFLKQQLPEQKADLCSRQFWGPPIARGCRHIWCRTITNKNNNNESCTHFAQYGVLKVTQ